MISERNRLKKMALYYAAAIMEAHDIGQVFDVTYEVSADDVEMCNRMEKAKREVSDELYRRAEKMKG